MREVRIGQDGRGRKKQQREIGVLEKGQCCIRESDEK